MSFKRLLHGVLSASLIMAVTSWPAHADPARSTEDSEDTKAAVSDVLGAPDLIGIGVLNLQHAKEGMTSATGTTWRPDLKLPQKKILYPNGVVMTLDFELAFAVQGPPYVSLEQVVPHVYPWQSRPDMASYHLLYIVPDVARASAALTAKGFPRLVTYWVAPGQQDAAGAAMHAGVNGINIEVVDDDIMCPLLDGCRNMLP
jgi:hypothetical protein